LRKSRFCTHFGDRQRTDERTNEQMDNIDALRRSRCREWRLNNSVQSRFETAIPKRSVTCRTSADCAEGVLFSRDFASFPSQLLKANKISKSEGIRKVEYADHFWK